MNQEAQIALAEHAPLFAEVRGDIAVSFEFFPPKTDTMAETLWKSIETLAPLHPPVRFGHLWRRRIDPGTDSCDGDAAGRRPISSRGPSHLRRRDPRGDRRDRARLLGRGRSPHRRACVAIRRNRASLFGAPGEATPMRRGWWRG